jgi:aspartyl-tRNA(Asn)/glutamyl-tRNA(Gln) amidotransferase subunit A
MSRASGVVQTVRQVLAGSLRVEESCRESLQRAADHQELRAIRTLQPERAWQQAERVAERLRAGERPALAGVPMVIKDNVAWSGLPTFAGRASAGAAAQADAVVLQRLLDAGAIVIGTANMDELAYGVTGANPHTGQIRNPVRQDLHPGGSSGGSAAAVAAGIVAAAVGTDTVGSVRIPASLCGVAGLRPAHGLVPAQGVAPLAPSLDCAGPLASSAADLALVMSVMAADPRLACPEPLPRPRVLALSGAFPVELNPGVQELFGQAVGRMAAAGWQTQWARCEALQQAPRVAGPIVGFEAARAWGQEFEQHPERFGTEVAGHLSKGLSMPAERYERALQDRRALCAEIDALLERFDLLVLPATAGTATGCDAPGPQLAFLGLAAAFSLSGHAACSMPMGQVGGVPVGLQLAGRSTGAVLAAAAAFESLA